MEAKMISITPVLLLAATVLANVPQGTEATGDAPFNGRLYGVVSRWTSAESMNADDPARVPVALRPRFEFFVRCYATFRSRLPDTSEFLANSVLPRQRALERALACLSEAPGVAAMAADYAAQALILHEWEGMSSSPLEEAAYAETYIDGHQGSPLVPYLDLFVAERARYAFEMLDGEKNPAGMAAAAERYRTFIARARTADSMVRLVANDLDGLSFVYRDIGKHPRDFPPASTLNP
jgi:hypothetical protein